MTFKIWMPQKKEKKKSELNKTKSRKEKEKCETTNLVQRVTEERDSEGQALGTDRIVVSGTNSPLTGCMLKTNKRRKKKHQNMNCIKTSKSLP